MSALTESKFIGLKKPKETIEDFQGCGINSLLTLLQHIEPTHQISVDDCKKIFGYDKDGISEQRYNFNKFNNLLKDNRIPYKIHMGTFNSHQEILKYLTYPVPVYFSMKVINFIKDKFKYSPVNINFGDGSSLFESSNHHLLLLVGYEESGTKLYFVDPVYQLPYYSEKDLSTKEKLCVLNTQQFYECVKHIKSFMELRHHQKLEKSYKTEKKKNEKQSRLE
ncbi:MAG: C39 family peptidase [Nanoarchaeota archaeon]